MKIWIVDDNVMAIEIMRMKCRQYYPLASIQTFEDPKLALEALRDNEYHHPNLIFLDNQMPEIDGSKFCEILNRDMKSAKIDVVINSSDSALNLMHLKAYDFVKALIGKFQIDQLQTA